MSKTIENGGSVLENIENKSSIKNVLYNVVYLFCGNIVTKLLGAVATMIFIRYSGATNYGILSIALAFSAIVVFFTDAGISQTTIREGTKKDADLSTIMYSYTRVRLFLFLIVTLASIVFVLVVYNDDPGKKYAILALTIPALFGGLMQSIGMTYFQIIERMKKVLFINVVASVGTSLALFLGVYFNFSIITLCFSYGLASVFAGIYAIFLVKKEIKLTKKMDSKIFDQLLIFAINGVIVMLIPQIGPLILDRVLTVKEVGYYAAAFKIPSVLYQFPGVIATAFYPRLFQLGNEKKYKEHRAMSGFELKIMSILGALLALPFVVAPKFWIVSLLKEEMLPAVPALVLLSYLILLQSMKYPLADYLTTVGRQKGRTIVMFVGLIISIVLYLVLGHLYGLTGGAMAPVIAELVIIIGSILLIPKGISFFFKNNFVIVTSFILCIFMYKYLFSELHPLIGITIIECIYILLVVVFQKDIREKIKSFVEVKLKL